MKYHQAALQGKTYSNVERERISSSQHDTPQSNPKLKPFNKRNAFYNASLKSMLSRDSKNPLFIPMFTAWAGMSILSKIYQKIDAYSQKHNVDRFKKGYEDGWDYVEQVTIRDEEGNLRPMKDWSPEEVTAMTETLEKKAKELKSKVKTKNSAEYGQYKVISDYLKAVKDLEGMTPEEMSIQAEGYGKKEIRDPSGTYYRLFKGDEKGTYKLVAYDEDDKVLSSDNIPKDDWSKHMKGTERITLPDGTETEAYFTLKRGTNEEGKPIFYKSYRMKRKSKDESDKGTEQESDKEGKSKSKDESESD